MTGGLKMRAGFNWMAVSWEGPNQRPGERCSYCEARIGEDDMPLVIWNSGSWAARFCDACVDRWVTIG